MNQLQIIDYKGIRVLTTQQLSDEYETDTKMISNNFNRNKERYQEGKHYIVLEGEEKREFLNYHQIEDGLKNATKIYFWTEKGCLLHAKSLGTDKAWEAYEKLIDTYFKVKDLFEGTSDEFKMLFVHDKKIQAVVEHITKTDDRLDKLEYDIPLYGCESKELSDHVKRKGVHVLGGKKSNAYKDNSIRTAVYRDIYDQIKREFGLYNEDGKKQTYLALKRKYLADAHECIDNYEVPLYLLERIDDSNQQMDMDDIA